MSDKKEPKEKRPLNSVSLKVESFDRTVTVEIKSSDMGTDEVTNKAREMFRELMNTGGG